MTTILVLGKNGQIGRELLRALIASGRIVAFGRAQIDLAQSGEIARILKTVHPDVIINAAAYTAVERAEEQSREAYLINAVAPGFLGEYAAANAALLIHYSTDYVFDGRGHTPYAEDDTPRPLNAYGMSKLTGEEAVRKSGADHLILRTGWVYSAYGRNFLRAILELAVEREELRVVADQTGTPNWARFIAQATARVLDRALDEWRMNRFTSGTFHLSASGSAARHEFAKETIEFAATLPRSPAFRTKRIMPIVSSEYPYRATRPANSRLATAAIEARFGLVLPDWRQCLRLCLEDMYGNGNRAAS